MLSWTYVRNIGYKRGVCGRARKGFTGKEMCKLDPDGRVGVCLADEERSSFAPRDIARAKVPTLKQHLCHRNLLALSESPGGVQIPTEAK